MSEDICAVNKIDSNVTGLRFAEERCLRELPSEIPAVAATASHYIAGMPGDSTTFTYGSVTYTLKTALSTGPTVPNEVLIGADVFAVAANITAAINGDPTGAGTKFSVGTVANPDITATVDGRTVNGVAKVAGTAMNNAPFGSTQMGGGANAQPYTPVFHLLEPNSYSGFGSKIATVARNPINPSRQRKKGVTTDIDASGGFEQDLTFSNMTRLLQGFFFATARQLGGNVPLAGDSFPVTVSSGAVGSSIPDAFTGIPVGALLKLAGFANAENNGLEVLDANTGSALSFATPLIDEASTPTTATVEVVGQQFPAGDLKIVIEGDIVVLESTTYDFADFGLIDGAWLYIGGSDPTNRFDTAHGFARIGRLSRTDHRLYLDKTSWDTLVAEPGTGKSLQLFFGTIIRNEPDPDLIVRRTYQLERTLGKDKDGTMSEYLVGAVANELSLNVPQANKVTASLSFVAVDNEQRTGAVGLKTGSRPLLSTTEPEDAYNTTTDLTRIRLSRVNNDSSLSENLFAFASELKLTVNNNVKPNKALGVMGAFDTSAGTFEVSGSMQVYLADITAVQAVRNNDDISLDFILSREGTALLFDLPLIGLGNGQIEVKQDEPITVPIDTAAAESKFGHTLLFQSFSYIPE